MFAHKRNMRRLGMALMTLGCLALMGPAHAAWPEEDDLKASPGSPEDGFGHAVGIDGEYAVVGAPTTPWEDGPGCAYIFQRSATTWTQVATLTRAGGANGDDFGAAVAISGDVVVIGAPTTIPVGGAGAAHIYVKPVGGWASTATPTATLTGSDTAPPDHFGCAVAIDGDTVVVGAWGDRFGGAGAGAAYIFVEPTSGWETTSAQAVKLIQSDRQAGDCLGFSVGISGDVAIVGDYCDAAGSCDGSAYIYVKPTSGWGPGSMTETAKLDQWSTVTSDEFGYSVSISGDVALVGVPWYDGVSLRDGCAYVFEKPSTGWSGTITTANAKLTPSDAAYNKNFGHSVSIDGDYAIVGADEDWQQTGSAYFFEKPSSGWANGTQTQKVVGSVSHLDRDEFGCSVSISGRDAVVGAHYWEPDPNDPNNQNYGAAYVFHRSSRCAGDLDEDNDIDLSDLAQLLAYYGLTSGAVYEQGDLDEDGDVDLSDLAALLSVYGTICEEEEEDLLLIRILTDNWASETTWDLYEQGGGLIASGDPDDNNTLYEWEILVEPDKCYDFTIYDSFGDGICCAYGEGYYEIELNGELVAANYNFHAYEDTVAVGGGCQEQLGACCVEGQCVDTVPLVMCAEMGGEWYAGEDCFGDPPFQCPGGGVENDNCQDAIAIVEMAELPFDTRGATFDGGGQCMTSPNIWYCYVTFMPGPVYVGTCGSEYDTMLAVYDGCSCDPLPPMIECNDDSCGLQSEIMFEATIGGTYLIEVGGYANQSGPGVLTIMHQ
jgi:hypothetical protein